MDTSPSRQKKSINGLSELPDCLLVLILSFLDTKDAVITSVLSKRWQFMYTEVPSLDFTESSGEIEKIREVVSRVHRGLVRCRKSLEKFKVNFKYYKCFASDVDVWVEFVVKNKVKEVHLVFDFEDFYTLPQIMYSNPTLKVLKLGVCIMAPRRTVEWQSLTELYLWATELHQDVIENILSGCPVLQRLHLMVCWGYNCLEVKSPRLDELMVIFPNHDPSLKISAPYIHHLTIWTYPTTLVQTNISYVDRAQIDFVEYSSDSISEEMMSNAKELLDKTKHAKMLSLGAKFFEVISMVLLKGWHLPKSRRRRLDLMLSEISHVKQSVSGIIGLLESSPNVETLIIDGSSRSKTSMTWDAPAREDLECDLLHLKKVNIIKVAELSIGGDSMLTLARILLKRAIVLEEMVITTDLKDRSDFEKLSQALLTNPRSSRKAIVVIR